MTNLYYTITIALCMVKLFTDHIMQICKTLDKLVILLIVIVASTLAGLFISVQEINTN